MANNAHPNCKCTLMQSLTGDGCRYCQPQEHIDRLLEQIKDEAAPQPDTVEPITKRQLDAIWEHGFDAESSDEQEYCGSLIRARDLVDEVGGPDAVAVEREVLTIWADALQKVATKTAYNVAQDIRALLDQEK